VSKHVSEVNEDNFEQDVLIKRNNSEEGPTKGTSRDVVHTHSMSEMKRTVTGWVHQFHGKRRVEPQRAF